MLVGQQIGPFLITKELGSGAMGTVYRADFNKDGRVIPVAFKIISLGLLGNEGALARFEREANILKQLKHPHIVRLIGNGKYKSTPYIVMEFVNGRSLDRIVADRGGKLGWEEVLSLGKQLCSALQHAHDKGIIHRDLKPSNLMVTEDGTLKLTDFGIAKDTDVTALTGQNNTIGTAAYMSPEQCKGDRNLTNKSDLYSLGVVFYELITGRKPLVADTPVELFMKHVTETPIRPRKLCPDLPIWFDNLIMFLMEKDKDKRPLDAATVGKLLEDIEEKVRTQQSLGAQLANAKRKDRPITDQNLSEEDIAIAKSLRAATGGKKKKKKSIPWYQKDWPKFVLIGVILLGAIGGVTYLMWPEGIDSRFAKLEAAATPEGKLELAREFLVSFGTRTDPRVEKAREILQEQEARKVEAIFQRYIGKTKGRPENYSEEVFRLAMEAFDAEKKGLLEQARDYWLRIKQLSAYEPTKLPDEAELNKAAPGWVAERRVQAIKDAGDALAKVRSELESARSLEVTKKREDGSPEKIIERALLLTDFGDLAKARRKWQELVIKYDKDSEQYKWALLAAQQIQKLGEVKGSEDEQRDARLKLIEQKLAEVQQASLMPPEEARQRRRLRLICKDIQELYDDETGDAFKKLITQAHELAGKFPK